MNPELPQVVQYLFETEDRKYPHHKVINIEVISSNNGYRYRSEIMSSISSKYRIWNTWQEIDEETITVELRERNIDRILEI